MTPINFVKIIYGWPHSFSKKTNYYTMCTIWELVVFYIYFSKRWATNHPLYFWPPLLQMLPPPLGIMTVFYKDHVSCFDWGFLSHLKTIRVVFSRQFPTSRYYWGKTNSQFTTPSIETRRVDEQTKRQTTVKTDIRSNKMSRIEVDQMNEREWERGGTELPTKDDS